MAETKLEKLLNMTDEDFQIRYEHELEDLAWWMELNHWIDELAPEIVNYHDFSQYNKLCTITEEAQMAEFDIDEFRDMIKKDEPIEIIEVTLALALKDFFERTMGKDFGLGDTEDVKKFLDDNVFKEYSDSLIKNNINTVSKPQIHSLEELLNQEIPKDYNQKQKKAISAVCDKIENESIQYGKKYGSEFTESFYTTAINKIADVVAFSSDNMADQIIGLGNCVCAFLQDEQPDNLGNPNMSVEISNFCDIIKEHEFPIAFYDFLIDERYTLDKEHDYDEKLHSVIGHTNAFANTLWEKVKDRFSLYSLNMCLENAENGSIWQGLRETCCTLGFSSKKRLDSICQKASKNLRDENGKIKPTDLYEIINLFMEKIPPTEAFGYVKRMNDIPGFEYPLELAIKVTSEYYKADFPDALTNILIDAKLSYVEANEMLMAQTDGFSWYELDRCIHFSGLRPSAIEMCKTRLKIKKEHELEQNRDNNSVHDKLNSKQEIVDSRKKETPKMEKQQMKIDLDNNNR